MWAGQWANSLRQFKARVPTREEHFDRLSANGKSPLSKHTSTFTGRIIRGLILQPAVEESKRFHAVDHVRPLEYPKLDPFRDA